ncbi:hypothetical protein FQZ97_742690 [compost metagenome]
MLRHGRHGGDEQRRIVHGNLRGAAQGGVGVSAEHIVDTDHVGEEDPVEEACFEPFGVIYPVLQFSVPRRLVTRVCPQALLDVADTIHVEGIEANFT